LKNFYINYVQKHLQEYFPQTVSYNSFCFSRYYVKYGGFITEN